ncbi:amino acid adenylation domain-containing protein [Streptomyces coeruleorubidus]|uniref:amino acid adenylation domain-containing protein n=1 Tax=Streptomyces coeruleorubidus TaxID=116188 RepID=UPI00365295E2
MSTSQFDDVAADVPDGAGGEDFYVFPASRAQQRMYFLQELAGDASTYHVPLFFALTGELDERALREAAQGLLDRHEALRTRFTVRDGEVLQLISPQAELAWQVDEAADADDGEVARWLRRESTRPFDLHTGPLFRVALLRRSRRSSVLLLDMHHIVTDGWSSGILLKELSHGYARRAAGAPDDQRPPEVQYADYSTWQDEWLECAAARRQEEYWRERLSGELPTLKLPTPRPRRREVPDGAGSHVFSLSDRAAQGLTALCARSGATPFMGLLAAFTVLLARYTGDEDILVGTPIAGRNRDEFAHTVGLFVNTTVLRADLSGDPTFRELLHRVRDRVLEAHDHQDLPFERLVELAGAGRGPESSPLFQVMFGMNRSGDLQWRLPGVDVEWLPVTLSEAKFDLMLDATESPAGIECAFEYRADLFGPETIALLAEQYGVLLESVAADPDRPVSRLRVLTDTELARHAAPSPATPGTPPRLCHERFADWAARTPDAIAVADGDTHLTYAELEARANRLAHHLRATGVGPGTLVGLSMRRTADLLVALLAVVKAGGAYVPFDPAYPTDRLRFMADDSGVRTLVVGDGVPRWWDGLPVHVVEPARDAAAVAARPRTAPDSGVTADDLAYVIYTSGSTGRPKGTLIPHRNIARLFSATEPWFGFGPTDVWTLFHSYAFDFSVWEIWGALAHGGRLVVVPYETSRDPEAFHRLLSAQRVTVLNQTPSAFYQLMRADRDTPRPLALRLVVFGGEALDLPALRDWFERHGDSSPRLVNMYGITETTVHVTYRPITLRDLDEGRGSVIGRPIPDLRLYVLDRHGRPVPTGVPGELYVGGAGLADGYLNQPGLTARRFVPAPPGTGATGPLYRTGDLVRPLPDGDLEYCGRIDRQVKLRGFRIELGEIEAALSTHDAVVDSAVLLRTDDAGHPCLAAYAAAPGADAPDAQALRDHLAALLPDYMVPASCTVLPALPLTANGKVDRDALPAPGVAREPAARYVAPRTEVERALVEVWEQVLGCRVGIDDGYFALGGDSIRSIQLLARAREAGLDFKLTDLMDKKTVRNLAGSVTVRVPRGPGGQGSRPEAFDLLSAADRALLPPGLDDAYPMTRTQLGMVFHSGLSRGGTGVYHNTTAYRLRARFDEAAWRTALDETIGRHDILRTSFDLHTCSVPVQLVHHRVSTPVTFEDLTHLTVAQQEAAIDRRAAHEQAEPFDGQHAPLIRFHVQRLSDDTQQLFVTEHHAILDGWSERSLFTELLTRYAAALTGAPGPGTAPPAARFRDYVALEAAALADEDSAAYWRGELADAVSTRLPRPVRTTGQDRASDMRFAEAPVAPEVAAALTSLAARLDVPLRTVLLAAHLRVMGLLGGSDDVVTGVVHNGRGEDRDAELTLGVFLNTLPLRSRSTGGSWIDLIERTARQDIGIQPHRRFPLQEIMRLHGGAELFETFFNFTHFHVEGTGAYDGAVSVLDARGEAPTNFPFGAEFALASGDGRLTLGLRYDAARFDDDQITAFHGHYAAALAAMARSPHSPYLDADLLSPAEHALIASWNATERDYGDHPHLLDALVAEQVRLRPEETAVRHDGAELSYRALDERAARLAAALRERGVARGAFVGVLLERSLDLSVALLAVLKAGAAYVPLDAEHPDRRIRQVVDAAGLTVVVTDAAGGDRLAAVPGVTVVGPDAVPEDTVRQESGHTPDDPAYMIFTSGSTGTPKGVVVSHRAICNRLLWMQQEYGLEAGERVLHKTPYTFDVSVWELFWPLLAGATVVHARPGGHRDPAHLAELIVAEHITTVHFVPSMLQAFVEEPAARRCTGLTRVVCSGEALPHDLQTRFFAVLDAELHNLYGPTEAAVDVTAWRCRDDGRAVVPIGRPIANMQTHVLDPRGHTVPVGVTGELHLSGVGLADGYHGRPDLTERAFVTHTDRAGVRRRMYRTGDLARLLPDGTLEYRGRTDSQVKLRGVRIELQEIEAVLAAHPGVAECAVVLRGERLVGYVVPAAGADLDPAVDAAAHLAQRLPAPMVPTAWVLLAAMPLTGSGKLDRAALPQPPATVRGAAPRTAPRDPYEERLVRLWQRLLDTQDVGVHDDFFALGGHSLTAVRLVALINAEFGTALRVSAVLEHPTIARQAALLRQRPGPADGLAAPVVTLRGHGHRTPLFLVHPVGGGVTCYRDLTAALDDDQPVYALPAPGLDDAGALPASVAELAERCLRAVLAMRPDGPYALAGWSFGGLVAQEMACRLHERGTPATVLALIDSGFPTAAPPESELLRDFAVDVLRSAGRPADPALLAQLAAHAAAARTDAAVETLARHLGTPWPDDGPGGPAGAQLARHYAVFRNNRLLAATHRPRPYPGAVRFYQGTDAAAGHEAARWAASWQGPAVVRELPADHYDMVRPPHVKAVADDLGAALTTRQQETPA